MNLIDTEKFLSSLKEEQSKLSSEDGKHLNEFFNIIDGCCSEIYKISGDVCKETHKILPGFTFTLDGIFEQLLQFSMILGQKSA